MRSLKKKTYNPAQRGSNRVWAFALARNEVNQVKKEEEEKAKLVAATLKHMPF